MLGPWTNAGIISPKAEDNFDSVAERATASANSKDASTSIYERTFFHEP